MPSSKEYKEYILEQLRGLRTITCKPMMRAFLLYYNDVLCGGIYDDRLLVKIVPTNKQYGLREALPYHGAKAMYLVDCVDDIDKLSDIILATYNGLYKKK